ncbi:MAG: hypothetical protein R3F55_15215 [Alphaproteobacteria bacterium]
MAKRRSWAEKLADGKPHEVKPVPCDMAGMKAGQLMLIPSARMIDAFVRAIPAGEAMDVKAMRTRLAAANGAEVCCPITAGIHLRVVAEATHEALAAGAPASAVAPYWRVIDATAPIARKLSFDAAEIAVARAREGLG